MTPIPSSIQWHAEAILVSALVAPVAFALIGALPSLRRVAPWMAALAALPALLCALAVPIGGMVEYSWLMLESRFGLDDAGQPILLFTALLWLLSAIFATGYMAHDEKRFRFFFGFLLAMGGNFGLILAQDMVSYLVFFALMSFASYGLVVHTQGPEAVRSGRVYIVLVIVGEILLFTGMILHSGSGGSLNFQGLSGVLSKPDVAILLAAGFGIKAGAVLLHVWLPLAHTVAPTPASAVLSGSMIKAGLLGWVRFLPPGAEGEPVWGAVFLVAGIIAAFYGVAIGLGQTHPKTVLAYSSISQMGLISAAFGIGLTLGAGFAAATAAVLVYAFHHALAKGALFLGVGVVGGIDRQSQKRLWAIAGLCLAALSLTGAPFSSGAVAKTALKTVMVQLPAGWVEMLAILLPLSALGTTILMGRFLYTLRNYTAHHAVTRKEVFSWIVLVMLTAVVVFLLPIGRSAAVAMLKPGNVWLAFWPVAAGAGLAAGVWFWNRHTGRSIPWRPPAGDLLLPVEWLVGIIGRLASGGIGMAGRVAGSQAMEEEHIRDSGKLKRIEIWEAGLNRWNTSGLILTGIVCALLILLSLQ